MINTPIFEKAWGRATKNIFRLEMLSEYNVPEDLIIFEKWKKGKIDFKGEKVDPWLKNLKATKMRGVQIQRIRIAPLPIPEYIRYEIDYWKLSIRNGEEILFLKEQDFADIKALFNFDLEDFWFFDDKVLVIFHYEGGDLVKERHITDPAIIDDHKRLKYKLLEKSSPMIQFLDRYGTVVENTT